MMTQSHAEAEAELICGGELASWSELSFVFVLSLFFFFFPFF